MKLKIKRLFLNLQNLFRKFNKLSEHNLYNKVYKIYKNLQFTAAIYHFVFNETEVNSG